MSCALSMNSEARGTTWRRIGQRGFVGSISSAKYGVTCVRKSPWEPLSARSSLGVSSIQLA
jgi:hypothetical protein